MLETLKKKVIWELIVIDRRLQIRNWNNSEENKRSGGVKLGVWGKK